MIAIEEPILVMLFAIIAILSLAIAVKLVVSPLIIQKEHICPHCTKQVTIYLKTWMLFGRYPILMKDITDEIKKETIFFGIKVVKEVEA